MIVVSAVFSETVLYIGESAIMFYIPDKTYINHSF